ncbi:hypothetical protein FisN_7Lh372 [Fistulifera solaris]|uniref:Uncharacterized protein n=1 Tax=Fistulifera solaris TaxID=1519565 RepID=A0A1Z5JB94_FISSO|nr:hypothetical protein FisN_7Lh372 [Fistulifera solaris]|eukprot:GAX11273.1 hypothetical protein FisN_7Lh372 [Fistulifera solaris]
MIDSAVAALQLVFQKHPGPAALQHHMVHCCRTLPQLHQALYAGLDCLQYTIFPQMLQHDDSTQLNHWLPQLFYYLVRLHDGLIFTISGECRSKKDQRSTYPFPSHLPQSSHTYHHQGIYNGTSWDEWNDPTNGLVVRYNKAIHNKSSPQWWWECTLERFPILEQFWNQLEHEQQQLQQRFMEWQTRLLPDQLQHHCQAHVQKMVFTDKLEQLKVKWHGTTYHWQRLQQSNEEVLPLQWQTPQDWEPAFRTWCKSIAVNKSNNATKTKRRRIVLEEEEDEEEEEKDEPTNALKVRIHHQDTSSSPGDPETSIRELKQQFGVNVTQLEASHDFVQAEEQQTRREGERIDQDRRVLEEDYEDAEERLELTKVRLQRSRQVLEHLLQHQADDDDLLWNAREHVRQLAMDVGNQSLWYPANKRQEFHLQQAYRMFQLAHTMIVQSQSSLQETETFYQRVLCLVLGQAQTNMGIVLVEQQKYRAAVQQLPTTAVDQLLQMIQQQMPSKEESLLQHELQAWQLYSLTMRWRGVAHWHLHRREKAQSCWKDAASCLFKLQGAKQEDNEHYRALVEECIMACVVCADMFRQALHQEHSNRHESTTVSQSYYEIAQSALREAIGLAQSLQAHNSPMTDEDEENVYDPATLQEAATELEQWWKARQQAQQVTLANADLPVHLERSDIPLAPPPPTRRLIWNPHSSSGQRRRKKLPSVGTLVNRTSSMEEETHTAANTRIPELPWGDALFPRNARGQPILPTYCGPPPMDPEMAVLAQRLGIVIPHFETMKERS